jgi:hypothetical protein
MGPSDWIIPGRARARRLAGHAPQGLFDGPVADLFNIPLGTG